MPPSIAIATSNSYGEHLPDGKKFSSYGINSGFGKYFTNNNVLWILLLATTLLGHFALAWYTPRHATVQLFSLFALLFIAYYFLAKSNTGENRWRILLGFALVLRLVWLFAFPALSDDWARFVWDGRLIANGINPFDNLPSTLMAGGLPGSHIADSALYANLNSPNYFTIYPPILQGMFGLAAWLFPKDVYASVVILKCLILLAEMGSISLMIKLCKLWNIPKNRVLIYALNPLVISELSGNVHHEGIVLFFLLGFLLHANGIIQNNTNAICKADYLKMIPAVLYFTAALLSKLVPFIFMPILLFGLGWRKGMAFCTVSGLLFLVCWLPFVNLTLLNHASSSIGLYFNSFEFNGSIYTLIRDVVLRFTGEIKIKIIAPSLAFLSMFLMVAYSWKRRDINSEKGILTRHFTFLLGIYLCFSTMVHPWYIIPLVGFTVFTGLRFPLVWSIMIISTYLEYRTTPSQEYRLQLWLEYGVVALALMYDLYVSDKSSQNQTSGTQTLPS